jgi:broad specificity phosphatase PhoE
VLSTQILSVDQEACAEMQANDRQGWQGGAKSSLSMRNPGCVWKWQKQPYEERHSGTCEYEQLVTFWVFMCYNERR